MIIQIGAWFAKALPAFSACKEIDVYIDEGVNCHKLLAKLFNLLRSLWSAWKAVMIFVIGIASLCISSGVIASETVLADITEVVTGYSKIIIAADAAFMAIAKIFFTKNSSDEIKIRCNRAILTNTAHLVPDILKAIF